MLTYVFLFLLGFSIGLILMYWATQKAKSSGTIYITQNDDKTLYSLELEDYPEAIAFKKKIVFKVDASEESLNRE